MCADTGTINVRGHGNDKCARPKLAKWQACVAYTTWVENLEHRIGWRLEAQFFDCKTIFKAYDVISLFGQNTSVINYLNEIYLTDRLKF